MNIAILDYDAGNIASVIKAFVSVGANPKVCRDAFELIDAEAIVVPGVGHFEQTTALSSELRQEVRAAVTRGVSVLGICLGLQWLFEDSDEAPGIKGLGLVRGTCFRLPGKGVKVPHVGWNNVELTQRRSKLLTGLPPNAFTYFTHSFAAPVVAETTGTTTHSVRFSSVIENGRVYGVQFHPEKSGASGLTVLSNFLNAARS